MVRTVVALRIYWYDCGAYAQRYIVAQNIVKLLYNSLSENLTNTNFFISF